MKKKSRSTPSKLFKYIFKDLLYLDSVVVVQAQRTIHELSGILKLGRYLIHIHSSSRDGWVGLGHAHNFSVPHNGLHTTNVCGQLGL